MVYLFTTVKLRTVNMPASYLSVLCLSTNAVKRPNQFARASSSIPVIISMHRPHQKVFGNHSDSPADRYDECVTNIIPPVLYNMLNITIMVHFEIRNRCSDACGVVTWKSYTWLGSAVLSFSTLRARIGVIMNRKVQRNDIHLLYLHKAYYHS